MKRLTLFVLVFSAVANSADGSNDFHETANRAAEKIGLATSGAAPFHLKIEAADTCRGGKDSKLCQAAHEHPEYDAQIEVWWAAPNNWRRRVKSAASSQ